MVEERRRYIRFVPEKSAFAAIGSGFSKVGKIIDISIGGLSFGYMCQHENESRVHTKVAIFTSEYEFHLDNIPCKIAFDKPVNISDENRNFSVSAVSYICGLQFTECSNKQYFKLEHFIRFHTQNNCTSYFAFPR